MRLLFQMLWELSLSLLNYHSGFLWNFLARLLPFLFSLGTVIIIEGGRYLISEFWKIVFILKSRGVEVASLLHWTRSELTSDWLPGNGAEANKNFDHKRWGSLTNRSPSPSPFPSWKVWLLKIGMFSSSQSESPFRAEMLPSAENCTLMLICVSDAVQSWYNELLF